MPGDNPSIEDLLGKSTPSPGASPGQSADAKARFDEKMRSLALAAKEKETAKKGAALGVPYIDLREFPVSGEAIAFIPPEQAQDLKMIAFLQTGEELRIGAVDPTDPRVEEAAFQAGERAKSHVALYIISPESFAHGFHIYETLPKIRKFVKGVEITEEELKRYQASLKTYTDLDAELKKVDITDAVALIMAGALKGGASDVHIEAEEKDIVVRYRIDGILQDAARMDKELWKRLISRLKLISSLKINVTDVPQDGRFTIFIEGQKTEIRVSTIPTAYGESVVMRILKPSSIGLSFDDLGIRGTAYTQLKAEVERPNGMIITTGPTGSGKTTTLYAILKKLNTADTKIITLEDPIEYKVEGINQSPVGKDYTFAKGLRAILRQDPDVIMVGEIRDLETAETAIQAALTGHLMVSTIHTNSAAGAIPRFLSMGVKPFLLAPALNAVIGQRLVRRLCKDCKVPVTLPDDKLARVKGILAAISPKADVKVDLDALTFFGPKAEEGNACPTCGGLGYKGRMGIYEIFAMSPEIEKIILGANVSEYQMQDIAVAQGMVTMVQDGLLKALDGITSVDEVFAVAE